MMTTTPTTPTEKKVPLAIGIFLGIGAVAMTGLGFMELSTQIREQQAALEQAQAKTEQLQKQVETQKKELEAKQNQIDSLQDTLSGRNEEIKRQIQKAEKFRSQTRVVGTCLQRVAAIGAATTEAEVLMMIGAMLADCDPASKILEELESDTAAAVDETVPVATTETTF